MLVSKNILRCAIIGSVFGLIVTVAYIIIGILFQETILDAILYCISIFFAWPFSFLIKLLEEGTGSYLGTMLGFLLASSLGGLLYGYIVGNIVAVIKKIRDYNVN